MNVLKKTQSICPECFKVIEATIYEKEGKAYIQKECTEHGFYEDIYWSDAQEYLKAQKYAVVGDGVENPQTAVQCGHPFDCGICPNHRSRTSLAIIDVTNRCNLRCPVCFANAAVAGYIYEPTKEQVALMLKTLKAAKPSPATALQFSGGEPTVRKDLVELVKMAKDEGFDHVEVNSNGVKLAESVEYVRSLINAGVSTIYLQFDGVTSEVYRITRGQDLLDIKMKALDNCRLAGLDSVVLVPTIVRGVNDTQLGAIVEFAIENFDVIRGVNFQPVSITGRIDYEKRQEMRITIPECLQLIEEQTHGTVRQSDFYPIPIVVPIARTIGALKGRHFSEFTVHEHCGMATFLYINGDKVEPITRYINVDKFIAAIDEAYQKAAKGQKRRAQMQLLSTSLRHVKFGLLKQLTGTVFNEASYEALGKLMRKIVMIGMMHFQDAYNFDLERLERCGIHYATPDGKIIPFCAMNTLHREKIEKAFSTPLQT
ncbi:MAG: radical SAM protein [Candidatus Bathyarchaeota archaeon]|nr:MAG: radical SAM protein [Candidatus Bathyarchaeota archaeon]